MSDADDAPEEGAEPKKSGKMGLIIALAGALIAGGGGFYATYSGLIGGSGGGGGHAMKGGTHDFVPIEPLIVSLGPTARSRTLKFTAQLEVAPDSSEEVGALSPRIVDVLNDYLRAVDEQELEDPAALGLLRAQMLRRIQTVVGDGKVRDLLIMEFILS